MTRMEQALRMVAAVVFRIPQGHHRTGAPYRPGPDDTVSLPRINSRPYARQETNR